MRRPASSSGTDDRSSPVISMVPGTSSRPQIRQRSMTRSRQRLKSAGSSAYAATTPLEASAWTPATGRHGPLTIAVLGGRDPKRSASVRDEILTRLRSGEIAAAKDRHREPGVVLVGGGPGDPDLITVAGRRALQEADVVVTDRLAPQQLLAELAPDVELIDAIEAAPRTSSEPRRDQRRARSTVPRQARASSASKAAIRSCSAAGMRNCLRARRPASPAASSLASRVPSRCRPSAVFRSPIAE